MDTEKKRKKDILFKAKKLLYYNNLLIEQCDSWLSAEEGNKNIEKRILERKKKERPNRDLQD